MILVQTPTGTVMMSIEELLDDKINLNGHQSEGFIDPMSMRIPHSTRDITDDWDLPDISSIEEIPNKLDGLDKF